MPCCCPKCGGSLQGGGREGAICDKCGKRVTEEELKKYREREKSRRKHEKPSFPKKERG